MTDTVRIGAEELRFAALLQEQIDKVQAKWEAGDLRRGRPPSQRERNDRWLWENMIQETEWDRFFGVE
jgi:hypothetical protein